MDTVTNLYPLSKAALVALSEDELLERTETLIERAIGGSGEVPWLRQQLDLANREGEKRKLICWMLPEKKKPRAKRKVAAKKKT